MLDEKCGHTSSLRLLQSRSLRPHRSRVLMSFLCLGIRSLIPRAAEEFLAHAVRMQWVVVDGDRVVPGAVNPAPMEALPSEHWKSRAMWGSD
jgi:hypothetical protein